LEEDVDIEHRRIALRQKVLDKLEEEELLTKEEEQESESEESESEYEEYTGTYRHVIFSNKYQCII